MKSYSVEVTVNLPDVEYTSYAVEVRCGASVLYVHGSKRTGEWMCWEEKGIRCSADPKTGKGGHATREDACEAARAIVMRRESDRLFRAELERQAQQCIRPLLK